MSVTNICVGTCEKINKHSGIYLIHVSLTFLTSQHLIKDSPDMGLFAIKSG